MTRLHGGDGLDDRLLFHAEAMVKHALKQGIMVTSVLVPIRSSVLCRLFPGWLSLGSRLPVEA